MLELLFCALRGVRFHFSIDALGGRDSNCDWSLSGGMKKVSNFNFNNSLNLNVPCILISNCPSIIPFIGLENLLISQNLTAYETDAKFCKQKFFRVSTRTGTRYVYEYVAQSGA